MTVPLQWTGLLMEPITERFNILKTRERNAALLQGCLSTSSKPEVYKFKGDTMGKFLMVTKSTRKIHNILQVEVGEIKEL